MLLREIPQKLLLCHFFICKAPFFLRLTTVICCVGSVCIPLECLTCNDSKPLAAVLPTDTCPICIDTIDCVNVSPEMPPNVPAICKKDFKVFVSNNQSTADEGDSITMTCLHSLPGPNLEFKWSKDGVELKAQNESRLVLEKVLSHDSGKYICSVKSKCGTYQSPPLDVTVNNHSVVILVICGVSALALVLIMGLAMKYKLKRDNAKHKERMRQRAQAALSSGPTPVISRPG
ncbi:uncharacterized protein LOC115398962 [Salarias fasciatus]|uniref:uncharacterized protein LOC115398962 n=1 Tax=Salarias fasciatus TaxID=181472 RepID=UPI0011765276|nr:uncharacterized protein LOC115398962 [Salarias fasciatus]